MDDMTDEEVAQALAEVRRDLEAARRRKAELARQRFRDANQSGNLAEMAAAVAEMAGLEVGSVLEPACWDDRALLEALRQQLVELERLF